MLTAAVHLLNIWHVVSHRFIKTGYWSDPNNSHIFSVQGERTVPAWFSGALLWTACLGLASLSVMTFKRQKSTAFSWGLLAVVFFYLSADEVIGIHEKLNAPAIELLGEPKFLGPPWVVFGMLFFCVVGLASIPLLLRLTKAVRYTILLAGLMYVGGAVVVETVGEMIKWHLHEGQPTKLYTLFFSLEELLEMLGVVLFLHAIQLQIASHFPQVLHDAALPDRG